MTEAVPTKTDAIETAGMARLLNDIWIHYSLGEFVLDRYILARGLHCETINRSRPVSSPIRV
jgi:hypothetical protein